MQNDPQSQSTGTRRKPSQRRLNRVAAMQFIYMCELNEPRDAEDVYRLFFENLDKPRSFYAFAEELAHGIRANLAQLDEIILKHARNWDFSRIAKVDLAILRLAVYELLHRKDIPPVVTINEAIDLSKAFSTPESKRFINGILDHLMEETGRPARTPGI